MPQRGSFRITVTRQSNDSPIAGAFVRVLEGAVDRTAEILGNSTVQTDAQGVFTWNNVPFEYVLVQNRTFTVQVQAVGFDTWSVNTNRVNSTFAASLTRLLSAGSAYTLTLPESGYVSSLYPIDTAMQTGAADLDWELIGFHVTPSTGPSSILEAPVIDGTASADLRTRLKFRPVPHLVPDGETALADPDFSDRLSVTTHSVSLEGDQTIDGGFLFSAANMVPSGPENDLSVYATGDNTSRIRWITLLPEPVVFRGFYSDVMVWLTDTEADYNLTTTYYNGENEVVGSPVVESLTHNVRVQRIRLGSTPPDGATYATLLISDDTAPVSHPLTVRYRG
ncbi:carboxypeptidase-like regulatory domain-containing protein [Spirosoma luteum]|uniref:carboxypeptidase-like regulatory domain-containing protein n=1 Tax=Spirosoma luteum TaxID=431553 RepID=UPI000362D8C7|nr:carboxypeptidase-like regulatory domain-containing protein [Spirosoma luteum]